ncbi:hypothetical protein SHIRM173S_01804 [Streptomyces hirsutus]
MNAWLDEAVSDVEEGLHRAGRFAPDSRHLRGVLVIAQFDHVARNWTPGRWKADREAMIDILAESWTGLLSDGTASHRHRRRRRRSHRRRRRRRHRHRTSPDRSPPARHGRTGRGAAAAEVIVARSVPRARAAACRVATRDWSSCGS